MLNETDPAFFTIWLYFVYCQKQIERSRGNEAARHELRQTNRAEQKAAIIMNWILTNRPDQWSRICAFNNVIDFLNFKDSKTYLSQFQ